MIVIAIDPGNEKSALVVWDGQRIIEKMDLPNEEMATRLRHGITLCLLRQKGVPLVIEMIGHYGTGMPAGKTVFDTCVWIGRFTEMWEHTGNQVATILRPTVKAHICGSAKAKDGNVRQAIIDRFGGKEKAIGKKATPGVLYGVSGDTWAALAVAITWSEREALEVR